MSLNEPDVDWTDPDSIEAMLALSGDGDIEHEFSGSSNSESIGDLQSEIKKLEKMLSVNIQMIEETESVIFLRNGIEIGRLEKSEFNNDKVTGKEHLYKSVSIHERGRGIASGMFKVFQLSKFKLPKTEYSDKKSGLGFLLSTGNYQIVGMVGTDNSILEIDGTELYSKISEDNGSDELGMTVKLELIK